MSSMAILPFDGPTYVPERDGVRLTTQFEKVRDYILSQYPLWVTIPQIAIAIGAPNASLPSISSKLRDMRKWWGGGYVVEKRFVSKGLWEYRANPASRAQTETVFPTEAA